MTHAVVRLSATGERANAAAPVIQNTALRPYPPLTMRRLSAAKTFRLFAALMKVIAVRRNRNTSTNSPRVCFAAAVTGASRWPFERYPSATSAQTIPAAIVTGMDFLNPRPNRSSEMAHPYPTKNVSSARTPCHVRVRSWRGAVGENEDESDDASNASNAESLPSFFPTCRVDDDRDGSPSEGSDSDDVGSDDADSEDDAGSDDADSEDASGVVAFAGGRSSFASAEALAVALLSADDDGAFGGASDRLSSGQSLCRSLRAGRVLFFSSRLCP